MWRCVKQTGKGFAPVERAPQSMEAILSGSCLWLQRVPCLPCHPVAPPFTVFQKQLPSPSWSTGNNPFLFSSSWTPFFHLELGIVRVWEFTKIVDRNVNCYSLMGGHLAVSVKMTMSNDLKTISRMQALTAPWAVLSLHCYSPSEGSG